MKLRFLPVPAAVALAFGLLVPSSGASFNARNANPGNAYALTRCTRRAA